MHHLMILLHQVVQCFPNEWDQLIPVVEYLLDTEIGETGFSAHELQTGYSLLQTEDVTIAPFMHPRGTAQTDTVARLFANFRHMHDILSRHREAKLTKACEYINERRHVRLLQPGEIVFRRLPP